MSCSATFLLAKPYNLANFSLSTKPRLRKPQILMSLHAQLSPEAQARLDAMKRNSTISSIVIAILSIVLIGLLLAFLFTSPMFRETPVIVTYTAATQPEEVQEIKKMSTSTKQKPSAPSSSSAKVIATSTPSDIAIPVPDVEVTEPSVDFGSGDDFGNGWSSGNDSGMGGGASFFNQKVMAKRVVYVIDYSQSMRGVRDQLMRAEMKKSIENLGEGLQFQMIFFAGPVWVAGQEVAQKGKEATVKDGARKYEWKTNSDHHGWNPVGKQQKPEWLTVDNSTLRDAAKHAKETPLVLGTIWDHPLEMALSMEPKPDIIFFMTDGIAGPKSEAIAKEMGKKARSQNVIINTVALMVPQAQEPLKQLAKLSGGQFSIVKEGGKVEVVPLK